MPNDDGGALVQVKWKHRLPRAGGLVPASTCAPLHPGVPVPNARRPVFAGVAAGTTLKMLPLPCATMYSSPHASSPNDTTPAIDGPPTGASCAVRLAKPVSPVAGL